MQEHKLRTWLRTKCRQLLEKRLFKKPELKLEDDIKMNHRETSYKDVKHLNWVRVSRMVGFSELSAEHFGCVKAGTFMAR
jgi:hypothetical protein